MFVSSYAPKNGSYALMFVIIRDSYNQCKQAFANRQKNKVQNNNTIVFIKQIK